MSAIGSKRTLRVALHKSAFGGKADIRIVALSSRRLAQNVNGNCRQNKRRHGDERDEPADDFAVVIELGPEEHGEECPLLRVKRTSRSPSKPPHQLFNEGDLKVESGEVIKDFSISYVTHGTLNAKN
jgi:hypothetical protein